MRRRIATGTRIKTDPHRWDALATYNAERARGIIHTPDYQERMRAEKEAFDTETRARARREGWLVVEG